MKNQVSIEKWWNNEINKTADQLIQTESKKIDDHEGWTLSSVVRDPFALMKDGLTDGINLISKGHADNFIRSMTMSYAKSLGICSSEVKNEIKRRKSILLNALKRE